MNSNTEGSGAGRAISGHRAWLAALARSKKWVAIGGAVLMVGVGLGVLLIRTDHPRSNRPIAAPSVDYVCTLTDSAEVIVSRLAPRQVANGKAVVAEGLRTHVEVPGILAALAVSWHRTELRNMANPAVPVSLALPHDEVTRMPHVMGILGQSPTDGSVQMRMTPARAARKFFSDIRFSSEGTSLTASQLADRLTPPQRVSQTGQSFEERCTPGHSLPLAEAFYERYVDEVANEMASSQESGGEDVIETSPPPRTSAQVR